MLQIRLSNNKGASTEGGTTIGGSGGGSGKILLQGEGGGGGEIVTVACPDHLVLADLPVAKSIGNINLSTSINTTIASTVKIVGRRSRRHLGERVHFCVCCDFPIAIYGRLSPCEHAFCLDCARSDSSCYLCDERIQKIQTIKMMEGIFICAAPHCLKSFLKKSEFETHINETHTDLLQTNIEKEDGNESDIVNIPRPSSMDFNMSRASSIDAHSKQSIAADSSSARTPARTAFSPNSNSQPHDLDDRTRHNQPRDQPPQKPPILQPKPPPFYARSPNYPPDLQSENKPSPVFDRAGPYNHFHNQQNFDTQAGPHQRRNSDQNPDKQRGISEFPSSEYLQHSLQQPNFVVPVNALTPAYNFSPFPAEGAHMFYNARYEAMRPDMPSESGRGQGSLLGFPPAPAGDTTSSDSYPRPWNMGAVMPIEQMPAGQGISESYANQFDPQGRATLFQGDYGQVPGVIHPTPPMGNRGTEPLQGSSSLDNKDGKGVLAPQPRPPPPPPPPRHLPQFTRSNFPHPGDAASQEGPSYGWQHEKHDGYGGSQD